MREGSRQVGSSPTRILLEVEAYAWREEGSDRSCKETRLVRLLDTEEESNLRRAGSLDEFMETRRLRLVNRECDS